MFKRGAMFGIDARIALIVMASLGLISTAIIYKNINKVNSTKYLTDLKSIELAYKNFKHDTNYKLTSYSNPYFYNTSELISLTLDASKPYTKKFSGPYIDYKEGATSNFIVHPISSHDIAIISRSYNNSWSSATKTAKCSDTDCFSWVAIFNLKKSKADNIDKTVDGDITPDTGKIRTEANGSNVDLFYAMFRE